MMVPRDDYSLVSQRLRERREAAAALRAARQARANRTERWAAHLRCNAARTLRRLATRLEGGDARPAQPRPQQRLAEPGT